MIDGEITATDTSKLRPHEDFMCQVESLCSDESCKNNVFVVRFKAEAECHLDQPHYHLLMRKEDPSSADFSSTSCAQSIYDKVTAIRREQADSTDGQRSANGQNFAQVLEKLDKIEKKVEDSEKKVVGEVRNESEMTRKEVVGEVRSESEMTRKEVVGEVRSESEMTRKEVRENMEVLVENVDNLANNNVHVEDTGPDRT